jgi:hypothetical protein
MQRHIEQLTNVKVVRRNVVLASIGSIIVARAFVIIVDVEKKTVQTPPRRF